MATGGVGEAMLISAVVGGATSAATGGDPLKGALLGAATGGVGAGIAGAGTSAATAAVPTAVPTAAAVTPTAAAVPTAVTPTAAGLDATLAAAPPVPDPTAIVTSQGGDLTYASSYTGSPNSLAAAPTSTSTNYTGTVGLNTNTGASGTPVENPMFPSINKFYTDNPMATRAGAGALASALGDTKRDKEEEDEYSSQLDRFTYNPDTYTPYRAASGGLMDTAVARRLMSGGQLGSYSDGGQALQGPGDGMSDSIPGVIGDAQPARLADGEFVVPADVVSGIGNGSTDAGSRQLYAMMDKIREARTGRTKQAPEINPRRMMPA